MRTRRARNARSLSSCSLSHAHDNAHTHYRPFAACLRYLRPGRGKICGKHFQLGTDLMYGNAPAALGVCEYTPSGEPDQKWSLRVFNDFNEGPPGPPRCALHLVPFVLRVPLAPLTE